MIKKLILAATAGLLLFLTASAQHAVEKGNKHVPWSAQSNIYEVNLRQYSSEGSFRAFEKHLPRLKKMGVEILWFMPITPIGITDRKRNPGDLGSYYAVRDYLAVNQEFGTMEDFKSLVKTAHNMGFRVITDWVANHSSTDNRWIKDHPDFYTKDSTGKIISPFDWTDTYKLNYQNAELRDTMIAAMKFWLKETGIDGFRCDVAAEVPADFWRRCINELRKIRPLFMLAEAEEPWIHEAGFDATYAWNIGAMLTELYAGKKTVSQLDSAITSNIKRFPPDAYKMYFTTNHDENSWNGTEFEKYGDAYKTMAVFTQTMYQSIPLIYSGQEVPNKKRLEFFVKDTINWSSFDMAPFYETLLHLRKSRPALAADASFSRLTSTSDTAVYAFLREKNGCKIAVLLNLSANEQKFRINDKRIAGNPKNVFLHNKEKVATSHEFSIEPWGYIVYDYR